MNKLIDVQNVRLLDVFVVAPFLVYASTKATTPILKNGLFVLGALTLIYNGYNYLENANDKR